MGANVKHRDSELVARRWAKALMELAQEDAGISKDDILNDLHEVADNINASAELYGVINNPSISTDEKQIVIEKLFKTRVMPVVYNFVCMLNQKHRLNIISDIADEFEKELEELKNIVRVDVTSAIELDDNRKNDIKRRISEKLHKDILVTWNVDSSIIAGLILNINETILDNSIRHKLEDLSKYIIKG